MGGIEPLRGGEYIVQEYSKRDGAESKEAEHNAFVHLLRSYDVQDRLTVGDELRD